MTDQIHTVKNERYTPEQIEMVAWRVKQNAGMTAAERDLAFHALMLCAHRLQDERTNAAQS